MTRWILVADVGRACIFSGNDLHGDVRLLRRMQNLRGRAHRGQLVASTPGRVRKSVGNVYSSTNWRTDPHEVELKRFARRLAKALERERIKGTYEELAIVAPPHFLGILRNAIGPHARQSVRACVHQDCSKFPIREMGQHLKSILPGFVRSDAKFVETTLAKTESEEHHVRTTNYRIS